MKRTKTAMKTSLGYSEDHAKSGLSTTLPELETWPNQYKGYEITIDIPEYTAICPKTSLPELKALLIL